MFPRSAIRLENIDQDDATVAMLRNREPRSIRGPGWKARAPAARVAEVAELAHLRLGWTDHLQRRHRARPRIRLAQGIARGPDPHSIAERLVRREERAGHNLKSTVRIPPTPVRRLYP